MMLPRELQLLRRETKLPVILMFFILCHAGLTSQNTSIAPSAKMVSALQGEMVKAECAQSIEEPEGLAITLRRNGSSAELCYIQLGNFTFWSRNCTERINLDYNKTTKGVWVVLERVSVKDSGDYSCTLDKIIPPPVRTLGQTHISLSVAALPVVGVSLASSPSIDKETMLTCSAWDFYPGDIQLSWTKDGQLLINATRNDSLFHNSNGTSSFISNLIVSRRDWSESALFSCQVNHSSLKMPVVKNLTLKQLDKAPTPSGYNLLWNLVIAIVLLAILAAIILAKSLKLRFRSTTQSFAGSELTEVAETHPPPASQSDTIYSLLTHYQGSTL
ncbi:tyrosine-protein phosphatase non-receptor type substrate 1-like [Pelodiscus sinensis]|uniref:tyrosine-protein phosphatase non-receptor type substrate 1-like n=1 Tax=Pelodiscus sinensis TaxID=13735 RepID=UPI003F6CD322